MASSGSSGRRVVTRTVETMGPDGKIRRETFTEEEKITGDNRETQFSNKSENLDSGGGSFFKDDFFSQPFGKRQGEFSTDRDFQSVFNKTSQLSMEDFDKGRLGMRPELTKDSGSRGEPAKTQSTSEFQQATLAKHNQYRKMHGVPPLKLSTDLCAYAQEWAEQMGKTGRFSHRNDRKYGENIFFGYKSSGYTGEEVVDTWYAEVKNYNFANKGSRMTQPNTGHFTQVVWKDSQELGIGRAEPQPGKVYVVANYSPPGNMLGDFHNKVFPKK